MRWRTSTGIDPERVCALGFSAGGQMVLRLLHQAPELIASAVVIGASQPVPDNFLLPSAAEPVAQPRPVVLVHGTADPIAPYSGGVVSFWGLAPRGASRSALDGARYPRRPQRHRRRTHPPPALPHRGERTGDVGDPDRVRQPRTRERGALQRPRRAATPSPDQHPSPG